jgi:hypothetical protein
MVGKMPGGIIAFGGGLALYDEKGNIVGGLGVSGDTPCADHNVAWRVRHALGLDKVPAGPNHQKNDAIVYDIGPDGKSASGFGHPLCGGQEPDIAQEIGAGSGHGDQREIAGKHCRKITPILDTAGWIRSTLATPRNCSSLGHFRWVQIAGRRRPRSL